MGILDKLNPLSPVLDLGSKFLDKFITDKDEKLRLENEFNKFAMEQATKADSVFRQFILEYEGSAKDYKDIPLIGWLVLLFRGLIRPVFTTAVMWWDWKLVDTVLAGKITEMNIPPHFMAMMAGINLVVLIFWFGERSIKYVMPLLLPLIKAWTRIKVDLKD